MSAPWASSSGASPTWPMPRGPSRSSSNLASGMSCASSRPIARPARWRTYIAAAPERRYPASSSPWPAWPPRCRAWSRPGRPCRSSACRCPPASWQGQDALMAIVQMPPGIPVATMAIGKPGARNAAWFAAAILGLGDPAVADGRSSRVARRWPRACSRTTPEASARHDQPRAVIETDLDGLTLLNRGKVRDLYDLGDASADRDHRSRHRLRRHPAHAHPRQGRAC